jgi:uncharacterized membrane protein (Fun14 family)
MIKDFYLGGFASVFSSDLLTLHNEHCIPLYKLFTLFLVKFTHWDLRWACRFSVISAFLSFLLLGKLIFSTVHKVAPSLSFLLLIGISWLLFSPSQYENWLNGWQFHLLCCPLGFILSCWGLSFSRRKLIGFTMGLIGAVISTYSLASGLFAWIIGFIFLLKKVKESPHQHYFLFIWFICSLFFWGSYFYLYNTPSRHPSVFTFIKEPLSFFRHIMLWIGAPLAFWNKTYASFLGGVGIINFPILVWQLWKLSPSKRDSIFPWLMILLFSFFTGVSIAIARVGFGAHYALLPRYISLSTLFWIGFFAILGLYCRWNLKKGKKVISWVIIIFFIFPFYISYKKGVELFIQSSDIFQEKVQHLLNYKTASDEDLSIFFPDTNIVRRYAHILEHLNLGPFKGKKSPDENVKKKENDLFR